MDNLFAKRLPARRPGLGRGTVAAPRPKAVINIAEMLQFIHCLALRALGAYRPPPGAARLNVGTSLGGGDRYCGRMGLGRTRRLATCPHLGAAATQVLGQVPEGSLKFRVTVALPLDRACGVQDGGMVAATEVPANFLQA